MSEREAGRASGETGYTCAVKQGRAVSTEQHAHCYAAADGTLLPHSHGTLRLAEREEHNGASASAATAAAPDAAIAAAADPSCEAAAGSAAAACAVPSSPRSSSSSSSSSVESDAARFAALQAAKHGLEAEDDAQLSGLSTFPLSRFDPAAADLADPSHPVHCVRAVTPASVPGLPARMYPLVAAKFSMLTSRLVSHKTSCDGSTTKLLIRLGDGQHVESVIMRHKAGDVATGRVEQRITLCVSSQVGCAMACTFCATGTMGMRGNLMMGEILEQLLIANRFEKIRNIVFMSDPARAL